jgi:non-reducing end alpha-L-arabinofuranosidase
MRTRVALALIVTLPLTLDAAAPHQPEGPCDIYRAAGTPCVAAHSTTRALYASYSGPLYQVKRQPDGKTMDIGVVGGYANAAAQDVFCAGAMCVINCIYDQSGKGNHLYQAPPGPLFPGPAKGAFDTQPIADMAPITIAGRRAYGVYIMPGMGLRNNDAKDIAIGDEAEGIYYVIDGTHYDSGCCFDYGNASTNGRAVGTGTMETTYFGTATAWGSGSGPGPWIMADMEAGLFSGYDAKQNIADPTIDSWRFVTAVVNGGGGNKWDLRGGNAQKGGLTTFYSGIRPGSRNSNSYYPMHKQGAVLLGTGGDNGNGSSGTFYEGVMTAGYPSDAATDAVQANIVAAKYDVARLSLSRTTTFTPGSTQHITQTFTNTTGAAAYAVKLGMSTPKGWTVVSAGGQPTAPVPPSGTLMATFEVTSPSATGAGLLTGKAEWKNVDTGKTHSETTTTRVRNVPPVKINEVGFGTGANSTNQFIELFNASASAVDLSNWSLIHTPSQWASVELASIPPGTKLAPGAFYLLGLSGSGLAAPANAGDTAINVRSVAGLESGQQVDIDGETRTIVNVGTAAAPMTAVFIPVSTGPWLTVPAGSTDIPVANIVGFEVGQKIGIDIGGSYESATVTAVGKAATQTTLSVEARAGAANIRVAASANLTAGDTLTVGTGSRKELVKVKRAGTPGAHGTGVDLVAPLRFDHMAGVDVSDPGTGISFSPPTRFRHVSGDAVQALGSGVTLDRPLAKAHAYGAPAINAKVTTAGYQGSPAPHQWFGSALSGRAGSIALMDPGGAVVVDAIVYGSQQSNSSANGTIASPEIATLEADQGKGGCIAIVPGRAGGASRSLGRHPDGLDADRLCTDFLTQPATVLPIGSEAGANNIKVAGVAEFTAGQTITIDTGANQESAVIAAVGTPGASTVGASINAGATVIPVVSGMGFTAGQTIEIISGASSETAVIASMAPNRGGATITVSTPLNMTHASGVQVSGTGITLTAPLMRPHASGAAIANGVPTPGAPNRYDRR